MFVCSFLFFTGCSSTGHMSLGGGCLGSAGATSVVGAGLSEPNCWMVDGRKEERV